MYNSVNFFSFLSGILLLKCILISNGLFMYILVINSLLSHMLKIFFLLFLSQIHDSVVFVQKTCIFCTKSGLNFFRIMNLNYCVCFLMTFLIRILYLKSTLKHHLYIYSVKRIYTYLPFDLSLESKN